MSKKHDLDFSRLNPEQAERLKVAYQASLDLVINSKTNKFLTTLSADRVRAADHVKTTVEAQVALEIAMKEKVDNTEEIQGLRKNNRKLERQNKELKQRLNEASDENGALRQALRPARGRANL